MSKGKVIDTNLYPIVSNILKGKVNMDKFKSLVSNLIQKNYNELYHHTPSYRIYYSESDRNDLLNLFNLTEDKILELCGDAFYFKIKNYNPRAMKDPLTLLILNIFRYCHKNKINQDIALIYLCFSPKIYLSIHSGQFRDFAPSEGEKTSAVMEYTISNISNKYEIKKKGNLIGSVISIAENWAKSYNSKILSGSDEEQCYIFQQLHNRIKQSLVILSREYYKNLEDPKSLLLFSSDNYSEDNFRITETNTMLIANYANKAINKITTEDVNIKICKSVGEIDSLELKNLMTTIIEDSENLPLLNVIVYNIISNYYSECDAEVKDVRDISFLNYSLTRKSNSNNKEYTEMIKNIRILLDNNSERYRKRKRRPQTEAAYVKAVLTYLVLSIHLSSNR